ncbi:MAG: threonylcarbamoyl-AMP synthase [Betaproteobacteria bacterium]|jgi:L-threonylcarbamoyladenylate synthase|nr:threonylcarbamoyl-AMP synthase [Betaproteobacteria bacterium]
MQDSPTNNPEEQPIATTDVTAPEPAAPINVVPADDESIARAADLLRAGGVVAFPTETVYGLGADALDVAAVERVFRIKGRPLDHPVIVHVASAAALADWARDVSATAHALAEAFWPGPLTLILKRAPQVPDAVTGGQDTVGLRVPEHPVAQALLEAFGREDGEDRPRGLAAPSANKFGHVSPTTAMHVRADLGDEVDLVLDGGAAEFGIESTILDLSGEEPAILRPGAISAEAIEQVLGVSPRMPDAQAPRAPGARPVHYAPRAKVRLVRRVELLEALAARKGQRYGVLALEVTVPRLAAALQRVCPAIAPRYAHELYANLRALDAQNVSQILVEAPPSSPAWSAINDRLARAARGGEQGLEDAA